MSNSKIEWTEKVWNPITGCTPISEGCANCYAKRMANRLRGRCGYPEEDPFKVTIHGDKLSETASWKKPRRVFVCSMGDLFHEDVPESFINKVFQVMNDHLLGAPWHTYLVLTKRPERILEGGNWKREWKNIWLGVTAENQARADERIPILLQIPAAVRFVSVEPMLGPVDLRRAFGTNGPRQTYIEQLDWVICGGETGPKARPMHPDWVRSLRDQCQAASVPFFFKKWGEWLSVYERDAEDPDWRRCDNVMRATPRGRWLNLAGGHGFHGERVVRIDRIGGKCRGVDGQLWEQFPEVK